MHGGVTKLNSDLVSVAIAEVLDPTRRYQMVTWLHGASVVAEAQSIRS